MSKRTPPTSGPLVLLGLSPSPSRPKAAPLDGASGDRLAVLCGLPSRRALLSLCAAWNLCPSAPTHAEAAEAAQRLLPALQGRRVVALGADVARALGVPYRPWCVWQDVEGAQVATLPHPSGLCREWNDEATREAARTFLRGELLQPDVMAKPRKRSGRLTLREAAEELGTTYGALRVRVHRGTLPVEREGRHVYVRREDVA